MNGFKLILLAALSLCSIASADNRRLHVDRIAIWDNNVMLNECGQVALEQQVFWEFAETKEHGHDYYVRDWRLSKFVAGEPMRIDGKWVCDFYDRKDKVRRRIVADLYLPTETLVDFEVEDRKRIPAEKRKGLKRVVVDGNP